MKKTAVEWLIVEMLKQNKSFVCYYDAVENKKTLNIQFKNK